MTPNHLLAGCLGWVVLSLGVGLLGEDRGRRVGAGGLLCLGLGLAAWRATSADPDAALAGPDGLDAGFLVVNGGWLLLGLGLPILAAARGERGVAAWGAIAGGTGLIGWVVVRLLLAAGPLRVLGSAVVLGLAGAALVALGRVVSRTGAGPAFGRRLFSEPLRPVLSVDGSRVRLAVAVAAAAAAAGFGRHLSVVFLGAILAAWAGYFLFHPGGGRPAPVAPALNLLLVPAYWLLATIAGPVGLHVAAVPLVPVSPAAERMVAPALLLTGWSLAGLWPLHRQLPGALLGPVGALLLLRVGVPLVPAGLEYWRPLAVPILVLGMWHAAAHARWPLLCIGGAFLGIAGGTPIGVRGTWWLLGPALALQLAGAISTRPTARELARVAGWGAGAWGGLMVLEGGLRGEVVYAALGAVGLALIITGTTAPAVRVDSSPGRVHIWPDRAT